MATWSGNGHNSLTFVSNIKTGERYWKVDLTTKNHSEIKEMQEKLTNYGYSTQGADGTYGNNTKAAVVNFQNSCSLTADGLFGKATLEAFVTRAGSLDGYTGDGSGGSNPGGGSGSTSVAQLITNYSNANRYMPERISRHTYFTNLDKYASQTQNIAYKSAGSTKNASGQYTAMCCASYPQISRDGLGGGGCTTQYNSHMASSNLKGTISSLGGYNGLIPGMEIFQGDANTKSHMGVYFGKYDFGNGLEHAVYQSSTTRSVLKAKYNDTNKDGPNLTQMNNNWKYWGWSKNVVL